MERRLPDEQTRVPLKSFGEPKGKDFNLLTSRKVSGNSGRRGTFCLFFNKWLQETGCYVYQFPWVTLASDHQNLIASSNRNVLSHSSGGQKSKIKVSAGSWYLWSLQRRIPHCFFLASGAGLLARCWLFPGYLFWLDCSFIKYYSVVPSHTSFPPLGEGWRPE